MSNFLDNLMMDVKIFTSYLQIKNKECIIPKTNHFTQKEDEVNEKEKAIAFIYIRHL